MPGGRLAAGFPMMLTAGPGPLVTLKPAPKGDCPGTRVVGWLGTSVVGWPGTDVVGRLAPLFD